MSYADYTRNRPDEYLDGATDEPEPPPMDLWDYIDQDHAEKLIAQHDSYQWQGCTLDRKWTYKGHTKSGMWFVSYFDTSCIEGCLSPRVVGDPKGYYTLVEALQAASAFALDVEEGRVKV